MTMDSLQQAFEATREASPLWLRGLRDDAFRDLSEAGLPTSAQEDWKYTNLAAVAKRTADYLGMAAAGRSTALPADLLKAAALPADAPRLLFVNGRIAAMPEQNIAGLRIFELDDADDATRQRLQTALHEESAISAGSLGLLNTAFLSDAVIMEVEPGVTIAETLQLVFLADGQPVSAQPRIMIRLGAGASLHCVMNHLSHGAASANVVTSIDCAAGASLDLLRIQQESATAHHLAAQRVRLGPDARLRATLIDLGAALARNDLQVELAAPGAAAEISGLFLAGSGAHVDQHTRIDHQAPNTHSRERFRGIAMARGRGVFNGKIIVHAGADGTDASLSNRNLLLGPGAEIDTKPELEIYTDDVKCSHGATTGQLDENALFYLRSRGIGVADARRLLVSAFAGEITETIAVAAVRGQVESILAGLLEPAVESGGPVT